MTAFPLLHRQRNVTTWRVGLVALALVGFAAPAAAHMLVRGTPLHELAASSPIGVIGVVQATEASAEGPKVTLAVERGVLGPRGEGTLSFGVEGHHPPGFAVGSRVLVFLTRAAPPFVSRQSEGDVVEVPEAPAELESIVKAVQAYAGLRAEPSQQQRLARLKALSVVHLESPSAALRREALLDLLAIGAGRALDAADVSRVADLAKGPEVPPTLGPGLVMLLASEPEHGPAALADLAKSAASPQVRALATQALDRRRGRLPAVPVSPAAQASKKKRES